MPEPKIKEKKWNKDLEVPIYEEWEKNRPYSFNPKTNKQIYSIDTPPPYVNAPIHMGHEITYILIDMFARFKRMTGYEVLFPLGLDRNGLPIEVATEKKFKINPWKVPRKEFLKKCRELLEEFSTKSIEIFFRSGISFNSREIGDKPGDMYLTDSDEYRTLTQNTFIDLWKMGLIYEDSRLNNYCPGCKTTVADNEVDYKEVKTFLNEIIFKVKGSNEEIIIATTRPELLCKAAMIVFNPKDERYKHLEGKKAIVPIYNLEIPIKSHPIADPKFGTGIMYMSKAAGDQEAVRFLREVGLEAESCITIEGKMDKSAGFLEGMKVKEARDKIIERLEKEGYMKKKTEINHRVPICERSKHNIEFVSMNEYYLKQLDFLKDVKKISDKINFYSKKNKQLLLDWIKTVSIDWPISRRRFYATEIPLWYCENKDCGEVIVPPKGKYYQPWKDDPPIKKCPKCGGSKFRGEERVFDTWFDSSISPLYILKYGSDFFEKAFPSTLRPQGKEIVRTWLYYTLLRCFQLTKKPVFQDVWIHKHILDGKGHKMSKSMGNVIDPQKLIEQFGVEPIRFWAATEGNLTDGDFRCSNEKIQGEIKFLTKLWNVSRFCSMFPPRDVASIKTTALDKWILNEINELLKFSKERYENYDFHTPAVRIRNFIWETFASHYIEMIKSRVYNEKGEFSKEEQSGAVFTLNLVLDNLLKLLAPIIPFITYKIFQELRGKDIHQEKFPQEGKVKFKIDFTTQELIELNSKIWKYKKDKNMSLAEPIDSFSIPKKFQSIEKELGMHKIQKIKWI